MKKFLKNNTFARKAGARLASTLFATSLRIAHATSRKSYEPAGLKSARDLTQPVIFVFWHGDSYLFPYLFKRGEHPTLMVARHGDGRTVGDALAQLGMPLVFGSGSNRKSSTARKGGAVAFLQLLRLLKAGKSVMMSGDVPKISHVPGEGSVLLARKSGYPIVAFGIASSRRRYLSSWDRMQVNLPLSHIAFVEGTPIYVPDDGSPLQDYQQQVAEQIDAVNARAIEIVDGVDQPR